MNTSRNGQSDVRLLVVVLILLVVFGGYGVHAGWGVGAWGGVGGLILLLIVLRVLGLFSFVLVAGLGISMGMMGCATNTGDFNVDRRGRVTNAALAGLFNTVLQTSLSYGVSALQGQNGQDAAQATFLAASQANGIHVFGDIIQAYAGPEVKPIVNETLAAIRDINPTTPEDKVKVLNTVGAAIQQAADQYSTK